MAATTEKTTGGITIRLKAYHDCDNVHLCWRALDNNGEDITIDNCLGYKIERQRRNNNAWGRIEVLRNRVGFSNENVNENDPNDASKPSTVRPFQRFDWTDHGANNGETVRYRVTAVGNDGDHVLGTDVLTELADSGWTGDIEVTSKVDDETEVYFNRGTVMSQYVARVAREKNWSAPEIKAHIMDLKEPLRIFLSGELRSALLEILDDVISNPFYRLYGALYELSDTELVNKLKLIKSRAFIVLSNGSADDGDGNAPARKQLKKAGVNVSDRLLDGRGLGHNKYLVVVDNRTDQAKLVWTGSTNWTPTGLCTQLNNGIKFKNRQIASIYYMHWKELWDAGSEFPAELMDYNNASPHEVNDTAIWFSRLRRPPTGELFRDVAGIKQLIDSAQDSIFYVMFQPGLEPLNSIVEKRNDTNIYIRGVVSTLIPSNREKFELSDETSEISYKTDLKQPDGIRKDFSWWIKEVTRGQFIPYNGRPGIGHAITHTKMIVIDPFSDDCKVITGSHNFSISASRENDENFVVISGNRELAEHYAVACMAIFNHYRWRAYVKEKLDANEPIWSRLRSYDTWQNSYLTDRLIKHLNRWC